MSARRWAYAGVGLGFAASITANIASTVLKETEVALLLRIPFAAFWPIATYVAIEVLARTDWAGSWSHRLLRAVLAVPVGAVAAFVSYLHQHHLMQLAGEPGLAQGFGPIAVDCLLFACAAVLILTRSKERSAPETSVEEMLRKWEIQEEESIPVSAPPALEELPVVEEIRPISPPKAPSFRSAPWEARRVVEMLLDGAKNSEIVSATGISSAPLGHLKRAVSLLKEDPRAELPPTVRVSAPNVGLIRELVSK